MCSKTYLPKDPLTLLQLYRDKLKRTSVQRISTNHVLQDIEDDTKFFTFLENEVSGRGLPSLDMMHGYISPEIASVFLRILHNGFIKLDPEDEATMTCFRAGFIHTEKHGNRVICILPSLLHAR